MEASRAIVLAVAVVSAVMLGRGTVRSHPGGTDDEGCHVCRTNCDRWDDVRRGERHCHDGADTDENEASQDDGDDDSESGGVSAGELAERLDEGERVRVHEVLDGDTLIVGLVGASETTFRVRVLGIDCPESSPNPKCRREGEQGEASCSEQIPHGRRATRRVEARVAGEVVRLETGEEHGDFERGGYGRLLAYVRTSDGRDLGRRLVRNGLCENYGDEYPHPRDDSYERAERRARESSNDDQ